MDIEKSQEIVRKFNALIERNKDYQAFSDFKEGINRGLEIAKGSFMKMRRNSIFLIPWKTSI